MLNLTFNDRLAWLITTWCRFVALILQLWRAEEAWPRSAHTGSLLPYMLRGKSPCLGAESATGRPEDLDPGSFSEAFVELWFWVLVLCNSKVMPWVFTRTPTERGSLSPCPRLKLPQKGCCFGVCVFFVEMNDLVNSLSEDEDPFKSFNLHYCTTVLQHKHHWDGCDHLHMSEPFP